ncbi:MAG TPA: hypothetical protein VKB19_16695 [Pedobacter sp.]|nr:hypothetical protein [Pedobacter sp.]
MIRNKLLLLALLCAGCFHLNAQERSVFRSGYTRLGINKLGSDLDNSLSPKQNVFDGNYGAGTGYVLEFGRIFYFKDAEEQRLVNYGLDWTYLSLNYNKMDQWEKYGEAAGVPDFYVDGSGTAAAISSKVGPILSINPIEALVVDVRLQIAPTLRFFDISYFEEDQDETGRYFSFMNSQVEEDDYDSEAIKNRLAFGIAANFGITVRRKAIGLSIDYISGKVKSNYEAGDVSGLSYGKEKIPAHNLQVKLSFSL